MIARGLAVLLLAAAGAAGCGATAPPLALGVQTHFAFPPGRTDPGAFRNWMQRSRFTSSRDEMFWWDVEDESGTLALRANALRSQQVFASMPQPFTALLTVDFGNERYDGGAQPVSDAGRSAFARYASYVTGQARPAVRWVEIWNEWNMPTAPEREAGSRGDAQDYVKLARTAYARIKADHPDVTVLTGSSGDDSHNWRWMRQAIAQGMLSHTDGVAVHLYDHCSPPQKVGSDNLATRLDALRAIVSDAGHARLPIYVTEVGWPTHQGKCGISEEAAATHSVRFLLEASVRPWVAGVWFYEMQDSGDDARNQEHRFGLLRRDGSEKPAGCALRELGALLATRPSEFLPGNRMAAARFRSGNTDRWLLWTRGKVQQDAVVVRLASSPEPASSLSSPAICSLPVARLEIAQQGTSALVRLAPRSVQVIDVRAGAPLTVEELN